MKKLNLNPNEETALLVWLIASVILVMAFMWTKDPILTYLGMALWVIIPFWVLIPKMKEKLFSEPLRDDEY